MTILSRWTPNIAEHHFCDPLDSHNYGTLPKNYCPRGWHPG
jgi:hypothetical protein